MAAVAAEPHSGTNDNGISTICRETNTHTSRYRRYWTRNRLYGAKVTEPERGGSDIAGPPAQTTPTGTDAPPKRPWWKKPAGAVAAAMVLAVITVGGYFGVNALLPHPSRHTTPQSTPSSIKQVPGLPPGANACQPIETNLPGPFNAGAQGTPVTSCAFVEQVRKQYSARSSPTSETVRLSIFSPVTSKWYDLACVSTGHYVTCTGGAAAVVYLYTSAGPQ